MSNPASFFSRTTRYDLNALGATDRYNLVLGLWPQSKIQPRDVDNANYDQLLDYIGGELEELECRKDMFAAQNFDSFLEIIRDVERSVEKPKNVLIDSVHERFLNIGRDSVIRSAELAIRLWLNVDIHSLEHNVNTFHVNDTVLKWPESISLKSLIDNHMSERLSKAISTRSRIDPSLTAYRLCTHRGVKVRWTDNLLDHLVLDGNELTIYRHKICLDNHMRASGLSVLPRALLEETIDSLNVLFPRGSETRSFLSREGQSFYSVGTCGRAQIFELDQYMYLKERLNVLCDLLNRPPRTIRERWLDRRDGDRWFYFLTSTCSIMIAVIGIIITTIASIVSTIYTAKQYELALAQACTGKDIEKLTLKFCS